MPSTSSGTPFFTTVRDHTVTGMFASPKHGGNYNKAGWKMIGFEDTLNFKPPFGYYDKDYAGWQPNPPGAEKTKA